MPPDLLIRRADIAEIVPLRHAILRAGLPVAAAHFPGDEHPTSFHAAALTPTGQCVGCATLHLNHWDNQPAHQLRGMAVVAHLQGTGLGSALLSFVESHARTTPARLLWANARTPALPFYRKHGWTPVGHEFEIPTAGPHYKIFKSL
jgi:GNAT superfamily N-acetyltransferase